MNKVLWVKEVYRIPRHAAVRGAGVSVWVRCEHDPDDYAHYPILVTATAEYYREISTGGCTVDASGQFQRRATSEEEMTDDALRLMVYEALREAIAQKIKALVGVLSFDPEGFKGKGAE